MVTEWFGVKHLVKNLPRQALIFGFVLELQTKVSIKFDLRVHMTKLRIIIIIIIIIINKI